MNLHERTYSNGSDCNNPQVATKAWKQRRGVYDIDFNKIAGQDDLIEITRAELENVLYEVRKIGEAMGNVDALLDQRLSQQETGIFVENAEESNLTIDKGIKKLVPDLNDYQLNLAALLQKGRARWIRSSTGWGSESMPG